MSETNGRAAHQQGRLAYREGKIEEAIACYRRALDIEPARVTARNDLGAALLLAGSVEEAERELRQALSLQPDLTSARCNLGSALQRQGRLDEAVAELTRAVELEPDLLSAQHNLGNAFAGQANWRLAEAAHRRALEIDPDHGPSYFNLGHALHQQGRLDDAAAAYRRAWEAQPNDPEALGNLGAVLKEQNRAAESAECYRRALAIRPDDRLLQQNLRSALNRQLPAWHFPMLADEVRNDAYRRALEKVVDGSSRVLDIGTGSGLLAMMAARAGAKSVVACEMSPVVAEAARQVVADNGYADVVTIVDQKSTALRVGDALSAPADVVVSEIIDVGLLGEGVLPTLRHARHHLSTPEARIIPQGATVFAALVEVPRLRSVNPLRQLSGFDLSAFDRFRVPAEYLDIRLDLEPYGGLTEPVEIAAFDFRQPPTYVPEASPVERVVHLTASADGAAHAVAFWFELALDDEITISTAPGAGSTAWGQAVQFFEESATIHAGGRVSLRVRVSDTRIQCSL